MRLCTNVLSRRRSFQQAPRHRLEIFPRIARLGQELTRSCWHCRT